MNIQIKTVLKNILSVFFSLCFAILFVEVILRITGSTPKKYLDISKNEPVTNEKNETLGWSPIIGIHNFKPWAENGKNTVLTFNNDTSRFISDQKENLEKIVFIGGSITNGWAVSDNETFPYILQKKYKNFKVYNFAVGGYGGYQSLLNLEKIYKKKENVKFVIYGFIPHHEVRNVAAGSWLYLLNYVSKRGVVNLPYASLDKNGKLVHHAPDKLTKVPLSEKLAVSAKIEKKIMKLKSFKREKNQTEISLAIINEMNVLSKENNSKFILLILKDFGDRRKKAYSEFLKKNDIHNINCFLSSDKKYQVPGEGHPNEISHQLISECVFKKLKNQNLM